MSERDASRGRSAAVARSAPASAQPGVADVETDPGSDWDLWRRACSGDAASAERLVRLLAPQAFGLAIQLLGRTEDAEDAVQDAFLRLWRSVPSDEHGARLSTYFNTIVLNRCRTALGRRREEATDPMALAEPAEGLAGDDAADRLPSASGAVPAPAPSLVESIAGFAPGAARERLHQALARLPARQRMAIAMWAYADADATTIARALELNVNAAHQLLHRAREALKADLAPAPLARSSP